MKKDLTRREFLRTGGKAAVGVGLGMRVAGATAEPADKPAQPPAPPKPPAGANEKIVLGVIGCGGQGRAVMNEHMQHADVVVAAVCDVDRGHLSQAGQEVQKKYGKRPAEFKDFRQLLERAEIDAVIIATPDHWHALPAVLACEAGKDIYLEKPIAHDIVEGRAIVNAAKKFNRVIQVGTWQRSVSHFIQAIDFVRSGKMGKITVCRAWTLGGAAVGHEEPTQPPSELDWDFWLGPAPKVPYRRNRCHQNWRWFFDYGAGLTGDWGVHMMDIVLLGMNQWHPLAVASVGGKLVSGPKDDRDTPDTQMAIFQFPDFVMNWEIHVGPPGLDGGGHHGAEFIGDAGTLIVDRGGFQWRPNGSQEGPGREPASGSGQATVAHSRNFLDCVKSRARPRSDVETMHSTTTMCHLANLAYRTGKRIRWDAEKEVVIGDREAMNDPCYQREYRRPWKLPMYRA
jgi:predicted dehydrogenase